MTQLNDLEQENKDFTNLKKELVDVLVRHEGIDRTEATYLVNRLVQSRQLRVAIAMFSISIAAHNQFRSNAADNRKKVPQ